MTSNDICEKAKQIAEVKNLYVRGGKGEKLNASNKMRFCSLDPFNAKRRSHIQSVAEDTVAYDEFGFFAAVSGYNCRVVGEIMALCEDISKDFSDILPGEVVFMQDRIGIYVGGNSVVAANPIGIGYTILDGWVSHGKIPDVEYEQHKVEEVIAEPEPEPEAAPVQKEEVQNEYKESRVEVRNNRIRPRH